MCRGRVDMFSTRGLWRFWGGWSLLMLTPATDPFDNTLIGDRKNKNWLCFFCLIEDEQLKYLKLSKTMTHYLHIGAVAPTRPGDRCFNVLLGRHLHRIAPGDFWWCRTSSTVTLRPILKRTHLLWLKVTRMYIYIYHVSCKSYVMI